MFNTQSAESFISILNQELALLEGYNTGCEQLHKQLIAKNWIQLECILNNLRKEANSLESLDKKREIMVESLKEQKGLSPESSFNMLLSTLDTGMQEEIKTLKRKILHAIKKLRLRLQGLGDYSANQQTLFKDVLKELVPDQKGQIYNSRGRASNAENKPLLINHQL